MTHVRLFSHIFLCLLLIFVSEPAYARTIIRDVEIEKTLQEWMKPLLKVANLGEDSVNVVLVQSDTLNAFVAGGANIFIYTGLIEKTENPGELIGVLAHEMGHIAGGHLIGQRQAMRRASYEAMLGAVLGIGAAILTGDGRAASAITLGAHGAATSGLMSHSRINESSADQAAIRFMDGAQINASGMVSFFEKLEDQELLPASQQDEYVRTHPLTANRIQSIEKRIAESPYKNKEWPAEWVKQHARMKAKLIGYIHPERVAWVYHDTDQSFDANYARAIAAYKTNKIDEALSKTDALIAQEPENPYLQELKGQMLVDFGRIEEAMPALKKAVELVPDSGVFHTALAHGLLNLPQSSQNLEAAISNLEFARQQEPLSSNIYRLLATAYGRKGDEMMAKINLAEEATLQGKYQYARNLAQMVQDNTPKNSPASRRAYDLLADITVAEQKKKE